MSNPFQCIGVNDQAALTRLVDVGLRDRPVERGPAGVRRMVRDASRARVAIFPDVSCAKPSFDGGPVAARFVRMAPNPNGCPACAVAHVELLEPDGVLFPLAVELDDIHLGPLDVITSTLWLTAFAMHLETWKDQEAFERDRSGGRRLMRPGFFAPLGAYAAVGPRKEQAAAIISATVQEAEVRTNGLTGASFQWARVSSFGGVYDIVAAFEAGPLAREQIIAGRFWLVASRTRFAEPTEEATR